MKTFNLSDWALGHRSLVWYFMIAFMAAGFFAYLHLGRQEDPDFTIKTMVIGAQWPGASPEEMTRQVTDRIEKKLEELESLDYTKSVTVAGQTTVFVYLRDTTKAADVAPTWARVRNMIADIKGDFPQGVIGPGFNDRFGDVFGNIYAFTSDGLSQRQLRDRVEDIRAKVLTVPNVGKVDILGAQDEKIFLEFSTRKIAALGLDTRSIVSSLQAQNAVAPSGVFERTGAHQRAGQRSIRIRGEPEGDQSSGQRPVLPADRCGNHHARLRRSADDAVPLQRSTRHRTRNRDEVGCELTDIRRGAERGNVQDPGRAADRPGSSSRR
jgi:multidrug efflux pump subunit AcrB